MEPNQVGVVIGASSIERTLREKFKDGLPELDKVIDEAMREAKREINPHTFMTSGSDDEMFRCAVGALLLIYKDDEEVRPRIEHELDMLKALSSAMNGVPVNFEALCGDEDAPKPLGLLGKFKDVTT